MQSQDPFPALLLINIIMILGSLKKIKEFLLWFIQLRTGHSLLEDEDSIPGLGQWVNDLVLLQVVA